MRGTLFFCTITVCLGAPGAIAQTVGAAPPFAGQIVRDVRIQAGEVFDSSRPGEDHAVFRWANALHVRTRGHVIQRELLLAVGDPYDPALVAESERNLRALGIFQDVSIVPEAVPDGVVLCVRTTDRWTTEVRTDVRSQGGISQIGLGLSDGNLFGRAVAFGGSVTSSTDVDSRALAWRDPRLLGTRWNTSLAVRQDDLQKSWHVGFDHPFYADAARGSGAFELDHTDGVRRRFEGGLESERLDVSETLGDGFAAWHPRGDVLERWGVLAARRRLRGADIEDNALLGVVWSRLRRDYRQAYDVDLFGAVEDLAAGWTLQFGTGADLRALGASHDRAFVRADAAWARWLGAHAFAGVKLRQHAFVRANRAENTRLAAEGFGYWQVAGHQTLAWRAGAAALVREPRHARFDLGGDDRLRGYEARHLSGERIVYANLEDRLFTNRRLFFIRLGAVAFVDMAAAWDADETLARDHARLGAGVGLRLGSNRSGSTMTGIDFAFGSGSYQISVSTGSFFRAARGLTYLEPRPFR